MTAELGTSTLGKHALLSLVALTLIGNLPLGCTLALVVAKSVARLAPNGGEFC